MGGRRPRPPTRGRGVLACAVAAGAAATAWLVLTTHDGPAAPSPVLVVAILATAVLIWLPFHLPRSTGGVVVTLEPAVLVFLLLVADHRSASVAWLLGVLLGQLSYPGIRAPRHRVFNVALAALAGAATQLVLHAATPWAQDVLDPRTGLVVGAGLLVFFAVDLGLSALVLSRELGTPWLPEVRQTYVGVSLVLLAGAGCVAYLAVLVQRALPGWALALVLVPLLAMLALARVLVGAHRRQWRSARLYEASTTFAALEDPRQLGPCVLAVARSVMDHGEPVLRTTPPGDGELGQLLALDGERAWLVVRTAHRADAEGEDRAALAGLCGLAVQAHERMRLSTELRHTADHDALTGLANRRVLLEGLRTAITDHPDAGGQGLVLVDLDDFTAVNDSLGHPGGDACLVEVARRLRGAAGPRDLVARLGGDEFAVLVESTSTAERVLRSVQQDAVLDGTVVSVSASVGVTGWSAGDDVTTVMTHADLALYHAKDAGKGRVARFDPAMLDAGVRRVQLLSDLRRDVGALQVHYQPVVNLLTGALDGSEALVRWVRDGVEVPPTVFVPLAEDCGLVVALGRRVLEQVVLDLPRMHAAAGRPVSVAVNLSARQLGDPELAELVRRAVAASAGAAFLLEVTERVLIDDDEATLACVQRLVDLGAKVILDDFGAGYSAIGYLRHLPVDGIKLDRSVVEGVDHSPRQQRLVRGLVALCQAMGITTLAEGVETEAERTAVQELGCTIGQGFLWSPALPLPEFLALLHARAEDLAAPAVAVPSPR